MIVDLDTKGTKLPAAVRHNLDGLTEIRDNAIHFINVSPRLSKQVLELGTAAVKNFIELAKQWFDLDLAAYNLYLMPIGLRCSPGRCGRHQRSGGRGPIGTVHRNTCEGRAEGRWH